MCRLCASRALAVCVQAERRLCASRVQAVCKPRAEALRSAHLDSRRRRPVRRDAARYVQSGAGAAQLCPLGNPPSPIRSPKSTPPMACGQSIRCRARAPTSPCFDQRIKLFFVSEPPWSLFYWLQGQQAEGPYLGTGLERVGR